MATKTRLTTVQVTLAHSPEPLLLTPKEAADLLDLDVAQLRQWRRDNVGPTFHDLGRGLIRYARESVETFARARA
jgi:hypothetical protein